MDNATNETPPDFTTAASSNCTHRHLCDDDNGVPIEAVIFLGSVGSFVIVLVIFFLYLNKSLCFSNCGGFPCIDKVPQKDSNSLETETDGSIFSDLDDRRPSEVDGLDEGYSVHDGIAIIATSLRDVCGPVSHCTRSDYYNDVGAAYQYDEESSSDSDDEVMKHYKETLVRSASMRSAKSGRSVRAKKATEQNDRKSSRGSLNRLNDPISAAELGEVTSRTSYNAESDEERHRSPQSPNNTTTATPTSDSPSRGQGQTFENRAFLGDGQPSISGSDLAQSTEQLNSDEHLFDVSDLQNEPPLISKCGSLEVSFRYDNPNSRMVVVIHGARDIPSKERGGASSTQVRAMLLPSKKQRHKSKIKMGDNPVFGEKIYFNKILPDEVPNMGLRFRLYGLERMRRERMIGESIVGFASLNLDQETTHWVVLEPRSNLTGDSGFDVSSLSRSDSASSTQSLQHGGMPELLLGLSYNGTTGRLSVEAIKGSNFRNMAMNRPPDTYVKLSLMNSLGQEVQHCKTSVRRGQPNPLFKETFMLQVALFQLPEVTLMVSVYNKKSMKKKEMIGWFSLGMNSSGEEEAAHWLDMRESKGEQVCRWHVLLES